jgi:DNA-binding NarL/FixJ family response regulator
MAGSQKNRIAELFAEGRDHADIAQTLGISRKAVAARLADIRRDLGAQAV